MASEKNPIGEYLKEKKAAGFLQGLGEGAGDILTGATHAAAQGGMHGFGQQLGKGLGGATLLAGGTAAIGALGAGASKLYDAVTKSRDFKSMLEYNPDLVEAHQRDPKMFNQMFSTLRTLNPQFSKDPLVAGTYMREMSSDPMHAGGKAVEALQHSDKQRPTFGPSVTQAALKGFGGGGEKKKKK